MASSAKVFVLLALGLFASALSGHAQIGVKATMAGVTNYSGAAPTLATSASFDMNGGNLVALILTSEASTGAPTTNFYATFAGQNMTVGVWTNSGAQWAGIFYLLNPATTSGSFVISSDTNSSGFAYSAISLGNVNGVAAAGKAFAANTLKDNSAVSLAFTTATNGGFVLGAAVNNGFNSGSPVPSFNAGNKANQTLLAPVIVNANDGHLHVYGPVAAAGAYSDIYTNRANTGSQRNAYVELAFETANVFTNIYWATGNGTWDINSTANWTDGATSTTYKQVGGVGNPVVFADAFSGTSPITVTLNTSVSPLSVAVTNSTKAYTISGSGSIAAGASLTKAGNGTLTLGTANTFSGAVTLNGGTTVLSTSGALGSSSVLSFDGARLQWGTSITDDITASRTVTINSGGVTFDTAGNDISFSNPVGNNGTGSLTKTGLGTLNIIGTNRYSGNTLVNQGTLRLIGTAYISNSPAIIVSNGATLDVSAVGTLALSRPIGQILCGSGSVSGSVAITTNTTLSPATNGVAGTLTVNGDVTFSGGNYAFDVSTATNDLLMVNGNIALNSGTIITISAGTLTNGSYKLIQYSGGLSSGAGSSGNLTLSGFSQSGKAASLSDAVAGEVDLVVQDNANDTITWSGSGPNNNWDVIGTLNWLNGVTPWGYTNGDTVIFDDSGAAQPNPSLQSVLLPGSVVVSNVTTTYTFVDGTGNGGGKISGSTGLIKKGAGTLIIQTENNNSGPTVISNGVLQVGNSSLGHIGTGNITNNGTLIFSQNLDHFVNAISGTGSLQQNGTATLTLAQNNSYSGTTTIGSGTLQIGTGGAIGTIGTNSIIDNGTLAFNTTSLTTVPTNISGSGSLRLKAATAKTLSSVIQYQGATYIDEGKLTITAPDLIPDANSVSGSTGALTMDGGATSAGTLDLNGFNETINALSGASGTVQSVITNSSATVQTNVIKILGNAAGVYSGQILENATGAKISLVVLGTSEARFGGGSNSFSGGILVGDTATLSVIGNGMLTGNSIVLSNNTKFLMRANGSTSTFPNNPITIPDNSMATISSTSLANGFGGTVTGSATATNQILNGGDNVSFSSATNKQFQSLLGTVLIPSGTTLRFSSTSLSTNGGDNATFQVDGGLNTRNGTGGGAVSLGALTGSGTLGGAGNADGNGTYVIGAENIDSEFSGTINGVPPRGTSIIKTGTGRLTFSGTLNYVGSTLVTNGTLAIAGTAELDDSTTITVRSPGILDMSGIGGTLNLGNTTNQTLAGNGTVKATVVALGTYPATILPGGNNAIGTLTITNTLTLAANSTNILELNRTNSVGGTNDMIVAQAITGNGTLIVTNIGPGLNNGDTFKLFSTGVSGFITITLPAGPGNAYVWNDQTAVDGTIHLVSGGISPVATNSTNISFSLSGSQLTLSWPSDHLGWRLQVQTNSLATGLGTNWVDIANTGSVTSTNVTVNPTNGSVFFRMIYP